MFVERRQCNSTLYYADASNCLRHYMLGIVGSKKYRKYFAVRPDYVTADEQAGSNPKVRLADQD